MNIFALFHCAFKPGLAKTYGLGRQHVGNDRDDALAAECQQRNDLVIVAGIDHHVIAHQRGDLRHLGDVPARLFDGNDVPVPVEGHRGNAVEVAGIAVLGENDGAGDFVIVYGNASGESEDACEKEESFHIGGL